MMQNIEAQIVQGLGGLLVAVVTLIVGYLAPHAKKWLKVHTTANTAAVAGHVIDGLSTIAQAVVQDFNQRVVSDAKANGVWNAQLATQVKHDAVQAVLSQGGALVKLAQSTVGEVEDLVASLVEQAVAANKTTTVSMPVSDARETSTADTGQAAATTAS